MTFAFRPRTIKKIINISQSIKLGGGVEMHDIMEMVKTLINGLKCYFYRKNSRKKQSKKRHMWKKRAIAKILQTINHKAMAGW
jgi:hypothetical protein